MEFSIIQKQPKKDQLFILDNERSLGQVDILESNEASYVKKALKDKQSLITINQYNRVIFIYLITEKDSETLTQEGIRKTGATIQALANKHKIGTLGITNLSSKPNAAYTLAEGIALANYQFLKYKSDADKSVNALQNIAFTKQSITLKEVEQLTVITEATYHTRTLVNEPLAHLTAEQLAKEISTIGKAAGLKVTVLNKARIVKEKMGGLLAVNRGSILPPTFTIIEHKPKKALNKKPIVLVGKGVVYDTGGLSLKPTLASMDRMKSDMSGSAVVTGTMYAIGKMQLPLHVIALVPATDNRPGQDAYVPGDVITMYSGSTVEVLNTDAEGRLLLADALHWAKRYEPELVMDFATLTGAAAIAVGNCGIVCMGTADEEVKNKMRESGNRQYERLVEYPLWEEYAEMLKSDIADMKNVGGRYGGAISAGKFLQHFTDYPWMHFDIAGVSFNTATSGYHTSGGTAYGLRMAVDFLMHYAKN
ncbi:MAG: leucyl aminopeptidase [Chitinophagales bacterium]|nr:leucyl aminopeptidase [Chitinophagaceae bacterium]MCB9065533.1 leucyl aminopeptidase [Chitinophagales bacterium]